MSRKKRTATSLQTLAVFSISAVFLLIALMGLYKCFSKEPEVADTGLPAQAALAQGEAQAPAGRKDRFYTILVGGLDDENGGSDTNLLVAVDAAGGAVNVCSLPRDTLLNVSWTVKKLNNAYHHGGFTSTVDEVSKLLGIPVDFYITVDLRGFVELVDAIEGVDFEIPVNMDYDDPYQDLHIHFTAGMQHLDGEQALQVVRWRQNNDGTGYAAADIGRIGTQQAFLTAAAKQVLKPENWDKIPQMVQIFQEHVAIDEHLAPANLIWFGEQALTIGSENIHFHTLPGDGAGYYKGGSYYVLDAQATLELVNAYFNPYLEDLTLADMDILVP